MAQNILSSTRLLLVQSFSRLQGPPSVGSTHLSLTELTKRRNFQTTSSHRSLEEFFDDPKNFGATSVKSGRAWRSEELRLKSNTDLHKLWFVLYKERNMLYTMKEASKEECELFPSPERIDKVEESMANLENVVRERNKAYWELEVSPCATGERPRAFRRDVFGIPRWTQCSQHLVPYNRNWEFRNSKGPGRQNETDWFFCRYKEMRRKHYNHLRSRTARIIRDTFRRFPEADAEYVAELNPQFPPGYVQHLKENLILYDDPPRKATFRSVRAEVGRIQNHKTDKLLQ